MKANINKPNLNDDDLKVLSAMIHLAYENATVKGSKLRGRNKKAIGIIVDFLTGMVQAGLWTDALRVTFQNDTFDKGFRDSITKTYEISEDDFKSKGVPELYEKTQLATMKLVKVYEYMTGKDYKTGKKIHKGVLDAD